MRSLTFLLFAASLSAAPIIYSAGGTFNGSTATSTFSAPNETWSFSFMIDSNPSVSGVSVGSYFTPVFSGFTYFLNGSSDAVTPASMEFFSTGELGMFDICFIAACSGTTAPANGLAFFGPQMYMGSESAPTMLTGGFTSGQFDVYVTGGFTIESNTTVDAIPEPSTFLMLGAGLLALTGRRVYRRRP